MSIWSGRHLVLQDEMARVFSGAIVNRIDDETCKALVCGWPDAATYRTEVAIGVLEQFADMAGSTEDGDAEVCRALENAGAFLGFTHTD